MNKIRIRSDGRRGGTSVHTVNEATGEEVEVSNVRSVTWQLDCNGESLGIALIECIDVPVDLVVDDERCDISLAPCEPMTSDDTAADG